MSKDTRCDFCGCNIDSKNSINQFKPLLYLISAFTGEKDLEDICISCLARVKDKFISTTKELITTLKLMRRQRE